MDFEIVETKFTHFPNHAVWVAIAAMTYKNFMNDLNGIIPESPLPGRVFAYKQVEIVDCAQSFCFNTVQGARASQWLNYDNPRHAQQYLRAVDDKKRRITVPEELPDPKRAIPLDVDQLQTVVLEDVKENIQVSVEELIEWSKENLSRIIRIRGSLEANGSDSQVQSSTRSLESGYRQQTEHLITTRLLNILRSAFAGQEYEDDARNFRFTIDDSHSNWECIPEGMLEFELANGIKSTCKVDILLRNIKESKYFAIEIKHRSAVTDQFKCRSYDMLHAKKMYGDSLSSVMFYAKVKGIGIGESRASHICYPYENFIFMEQVDTKAYLSLPDMKYLGLVETVKAFLNK